LDEIYTAECSRKITQGRVDGVLKDEVTESSGAARIFKTGVSFFKSTEQARMLALNIP